MHNGSRKGDEQMIKVTDSVHYGAKWLAQIAESIRVQALALQAGDPNAAHELDRLHRSLRLHTGALLSGIEADRQLKLTPR